VSLGYVALAGTRDDRAVLPGEASGLLLGLIIVQDEESVNDGDQQHREKAADNERGHREKPQGKVRRGMSRSATEPDSDGTCNNR